MAALAAPVPKYEIVRLGEQFDIPVIFSPVSHPELNPIEDMWAITKTVVRSRNGYPEYQNGEPTFTMRHLGTHIDFAMAQCKSEVWSSKVDIVISRETQYLLAADVEEAIHELSDNEGDASGMDIDDF